MFEIEIMHLLNDYKNIDDSQKDKIKLSISNLIKQNNDDFNKFLSSSQLDNETKNFLNSCSKKIIKKNKTNSQPSDFNLIKEKYETWLKNFNKNNKIPNQNCEKIILDIINFYALNRFDVIEELLKMNDSEDFESFKNMLKNYLRKYFTEKIELYYNGESFHDLNMIAKWKKKRRILYILDEIGRYEFNIKKMLEVL